MYQEILTFWFEELTPKEWFVKNAAIDKQIETRFAPLLEQAAKAELFDWRDSAKGRLAEIILLDQFSRNIYRDTPRAFAQDPLALALAQEAVRTKADQQLNVAERSFLYMPFMHSESKRIHVEAEKLFKALGNPTNYQFELEHKAIIDRFGRYPHRNAVLNRVSTPEESAFLQQPNSAF